MSVSLFVSFCLPAYAETDYVTVTVKRGETVYGICKDMGLDYNMNKSIILSLNGFTKESQLSNLAAGTKLKLPTENPPKKSNEIPKGDTVEYYLVPFYFEKGDTLSRIYYCWGLQYETYAEDIRSINGISNLDKIHAGKTLLLPTTEENLMSETYTTIMAHTMQVGDTAYEICKDYGLDYDKAKENLTDLNRGADLTKLKVGDKMLIPLK